MHPTNCGEMLSNERAEFLRHVLHIFLMKINIAKNQFMPDLVFNCPKLKKRQDLNQLRSNYSGLGN